ncbi:iron ABC transporter permease [Salmonella enterica subsp. diarizonae]|nr:iron ABC transporter permease [Salmonella enterica subsp. diarizonae]EAP9508541.1 iron ABC transporter permease [Salmonella enterica]EBQ9005107.1 iron ABC transporter permease [Salmonella enterica subsp. enterica serovar Blockley]ECD6160877.1 iron ABC transporter permease [Salmonella enterica subsp. enterica]ECU7992287.1 iron ABC transporter permease [Salmonella enterica subsp. enterica serovar Toucra]HAD5966332.1 iron ABC transporter permease [Salmonella enterica subsp. enterica serovar Ty
MATRYFICIWIFSLFLLAGMMFTGLVYGATEITFSDILNSLVPGNSRVSPVIRSVILELRLPRVLAGILTGAGLALSGALLQTATRNDLADPFLFGLSSGASAGAVWVITRVGDKLGDWTLPVAAFSGGIISAVTVTALFIYHSHRGTSTLVITGLAVSFLFSALTSYLIFTGDQRAAASILFWSLGGLGLARWDNLPLLIAGIVLIAAFIAVRWKDFDALLTGEQTAYTLGINVTRLRCEIFVCCALTTSSLVALTGVIGFVGLMVPHVARVAGGALHLRMLPLVALLGAITLTGGDILSRTLTPPQELPLGIITGGMGGAFILLMLLRKKL